jgi:hypothetical protein
MKDCTKINILVECGVKISNNDEGEKINSTTLIKSLVESLGYLICICLDILNYDSLQSLEANSSVYQMYY